LLRGVARLPAAPVVAFIDENKDEMVGRTPAWGQVHLQGVAGGFEPVLRGPGPPAVVARQRDAELVPQLIELWKQNDEVYGSRKLWSAARRCGIDIGRDQTRRLMRKAGIQGALCTKRVRSTRPDHGAGRHRIWSLAGSSSGRRTAFG
jgi:hypothetical protein